MFNVNISKIKIHPELKETFSCLGTVDANACGFAGCRFTEPLSVEGSFRAAGDGYFVAKATYRTELELVCGRCGITFRQPFSGAFQARYSSQPEEDEDGEFEVFPIEGDLADVSQPALNEIFFALPMQPLCRQDCKGLCPVCGVDLNHHSCSCQDQQIDPRWEKLRQFTIQE